MKSNEKNKSDSLKAVALQYQNESKKDAPQIIAKGSGDLANEIIQIAKNHGIYVHEDQQLSEILNHLDLGQEIPEQLYVVIAELISFSYLLQGKFPTRWKNQHQHIDFKE
ncbi:EscU/YscU/HrcU family type III secretion system export apparatus switch protein [Agaribacter marinus]|uniref:Flagellar biosynthetic protein FlhB n=1 Tax=Agaribacter marinus TaxID=1431249 RepID=A0AA37SZK2_9ALTE|nr:EscU/YscU/HrcU family type III secretion system export apparatus switch protein [Agaribacter marinus]GLR70905.1 hypothetical protein GCM10007852_18130 [Agaribacter marinus]